VTRLVWDDANRRHLITDHPERKLTTGEIEEVVLDPLAVVYREEHGSWEALGRTSGGRWLIVAWVEEPEGMYPIHARPISVRAIRRWLRRWQR